MQQTHTHTLTPGTLFKIFDQHLVCTHGSAKSVPQKKMIPSWHNEINIQTCANTSHKSDQPHMHTHTHMYMKTKTVLFFCTVYSRLMCSHSHTHTDSWKQCCCPSFSCNARHTQEGKPTALLPQLHWLELTRFLGYGRLHHNSQRDFLSDLFSSDRKSSSHYAEFYSLFIGVITKQ